MKVLLIAPYFQRITTGHIVVPRGDFIPSAALLHLASILNNTITNLFCDFNNVETDEHRDNYIDYCKKVITKTITKKTRSSWYKLSFFWSVS